MAGVARHWRLVPWGLLLVGIALRLLAITRFTVSADAAEYAVLGRSILEGRGMWLPRGEAWDLDAWTPGPSRRPRGRDRADCDLLHRDAGPLWAGQGDVVRGPPRPGSRPHHDDGHRICGELPRPSLRGDRRRHPEELEGPEVDPRSERLRGPRVPHEELRRAVLPHR